MHPTNMQSELKTYPVPWQGQILLACRKCQKKLKGNKDLEALARLKKTVKRHNRRHPETPLHLVPIACTNLCPKDGVTACDPAQQPARLFILRSEDDVKASLRHRQ
jgi:hypothetical protein